MSKFTAAGPGRSREGDHPHGPAPAEADRRGRPPGPSGVGGHRGLATTRAPSLAARPAPAPAEPGQLRTPAEAAGERAVAAVHRPGPAEHSRTDGAGEVAQGGVGAGKTAQDAVAVQTVDRKSTRLNSSHVAISYAVVCLKKKES